jgi:integrase
LGSDQQEDGMGKASTVALTKTVIDGAEPGAKNYALWDSKLSGFGIQIGTGGAKTFIIRYRAEGGGRTARRPQMTVGRFGTLTVEQGRAQAKKLLAAATIGEDPAGERQGKRREMKMSALIDVYEEEGCYIQRGKRQGQPMKAKTKQFTIARLRHHVVPLLGHKRVTEVTPRDIERFFRDVEAGKTAKDEKVAPRKRIIVKGGSGAARKVFRDLSAVFSFAGRDGTVAVNPCEKAVVAKTDNARTRFLTFDEVARFGAACDALEAEGVNRKGLNVARLYALTGCRRDEIAALRWSEVDLERGLLVLDDTKTGKSIRPLAFAAITLLRGIDKQDGSDFVFPAEFGDGHYQSGKRTWGKIVKRAELPGISPHTLRHTMGSAATSLGEALALTGAILGHSNPRSTAIYAHVQHDPSKKAANRVGRQIANALKGEHRKPKGRTAAEPAQA